jgi:uncharacterized repeat protein (TIGR03837 family)
MESAHVQRKVSSFSPECRPMTIDILCKVVDNFGDIGVAYRLAKALTDLDGTLSIRLHVDDLAAFHAVCPEVDAEREVQAVRGWTLLRWNADWAGLRELPPRVVLECFACGRPERFEELLYDPADPAPRYVLNIEHLTAESWAKDFHLLPSATRSGLVKKWMFMPGFSEGTGGLIIDRRFREARAGALAAEGRAGGREARREAVAAELAALGTRPARDLARRRWVSVFSYERDYGRVVEDLALADRERPLAVLAAAGRSQACFLAAWEAALRPFPVLELPFLPQEIWDEVILASDFSIVRGEESLARAALSGRPFLWHAYLQDERYQLVKVRALLDRLRPHFDHGAGGLGSFGPIEEAFLAFNDRERDESGTLGRERISPFLAAGAAAPFRALAEDLVALGDLAEHLMTFLGKIG